MNHDGLVAEMRTLREQVAGVTDAAVVAVDGLLIAADTEDGIDPDALAALAAAGLGLARRTTATCGRGTFQQSVTHGTAGCAAMYAVGDTALMVVLGDEGLNLGRLEAESLKAVERIKGVLSLPGASRADR
ncbi:roadblock/LC7 domain-containing protein [Streptomyces sp. MUM 178J]|uniref:roadblock/LC7 domain-containing protein n=1 Tax=Streptomyces sp. MUM 178J TaxID=2791991 RepID=UPI001F035087|nr:roadblock/LC7 domain-containing protein [Streptomyces sp. MUM 178J]WRQ82014.1 roadblock/LC7 domain-containing protein [Streptomyces sp. MUM 178J]